MFYNNAPIQYSIINIMSYTSNGVGIKINNIIPFGVISCLAAGMFERDLPIKLSSVVDRNASYFIHFYLHVSSPTTVYFEPLVRWLHIVYYYSSLRHTHLTFFFPRGGSWQAPKGRGLKYFAHTSTHIRFAYFTVHVCHTLIPHILYYME